MRNDGRSRRLQNKGTALNKKGISGTVLFLILSSIAIVMIFTGTIFSYQQLACYAGVDWAETRYPTPRAESFFASKIDINKFDPPLVTTQGKCRTDCGADVDCKSQCDDDYPDPAAEYAKFNIETTYKGAAPAKVSIRVFEEFDGTRVDLFADCETTQGLVTQQVGPTLVSESRLKNGDSFNKGFVVEIRRGCTSSLSVRAEAKDVSGVVPGFSKLEETVDFCVTPPRRDINVSVNDFVYNDDSNDAKDSVKATVGINGSAVQIADLCPAAIVRFRTFDSDGNPVTLPCTDIVETKQELWLDEYRYRSQFDVTNTLPDSEENIVMNEAIRVTLDFSPSFVGVEHNMTDCSELAITKLGKEDTLSRWVNSTKFECYGDPGNPVDYDINNDGVINESDCRCIEADIIFHYMDKDGIADKDDYEIDPTLPEPDWEFEPGETVTFNAYFHVKPGETINAGITNAATLADVINSAAEPSYTWVPEADGGQLSDITVGTYYTPKAADPPTNVVYYFEDNVIHLDFEREGLC